MTSSRRTRGASQHGRALLGLTSVLLVVAVIVAGGAYYIVRSMLAPAWIRANVIPGLEARYGRRITFDDFRIRPRGLILGGVRVFEDAEFDFDGAPFLFVDHVVVRFDPIALVRRTFLVDFVRLVGAEIRLFQDQRGRWNTSSLSEAASDVPQKTDGSASQIASRFRLVVTRVELSDAIVRVRRVRTDGSEASREMLAESLDASVLFHPMTGFLDYEAQGNLSLPSSVSAAEPEPESTSGPAAEPAALKAFGVLDLGGPRLELQISAENLDADELREFWIEPNADRPRVKIEEIFNANVEHDLLFVATNLRAGGIDIGALRLELGASKRAIELRKLDVGAFGGTLHADGNADLTSTPPALAFAATLRTLDVAAIAAALAPPGVSKAIDGTVTGTVSVSGPWVEGKPPTASAQLELALDRLDGPALSAAWGEAAKKNAGSDSPPIDPKAITVALSAKAKSATLGTVALNAVALKAKVERGKLDVSELTAEVFGGRVLVSGTVGLAEKTLPWRGTLALEKARYEDFVPETPRADWARTTGTVDLELHGAAQGLTLAQVRDSLARKEDSGPDKAFDNGHARIAVRALDLDKLGKPPRERDELGPYALGNVMLDAHVEVDTLRLWRLDYANAVADAHFENDRIKVEKIAGSIADGDLELSGDVNLARKGLSYFGHGALKQVETSTFVEAYLPPDIGYVSGRGSAAFEFSLTGTKKVSALDSLAVDGYIALHSGQVKESSLFKRIAKSTGVDEFKELELTRCGGDIHIANRRVSTERLVLGGTDARVLLVGSAGFDSSVNAEVWLGFSPDTQRNIFSRGILLPYVTDAKGWTFVPVVTRGSLKEPSITIADEAIRSTAIHAIPDATERIVRESSRLVPGGEAIVGGGIDAMKYILSGLGRVLQANSARAKGQVPLDEPVLPTPMPTPPPGPPPAAPPEATPTPPAETAPPTDVVGEGAPPS